MKIKNLLPLLLLVLALFAAADAQTSNNSATNDWLQFRGPYGTGVADRVFLTAAEGDKLSTLALDRKSGKVLWRRDVVRARHMPIYRANDGASPTPVSDGKNVFVFFAELELISYGPDGKERRRVPLGPFNSFYGMGGSPVLAGNTVGERAK